MNFERSSNKTMKLKPKGRKIYRYKTRFERVKSFFRSKRTVFATVLAILCLAFVGYSVGGPVLRFLEEREIIAPVSEKDKEQQTGEVPTEADTSSAESAEATEAATEETTEAPGEVLSDVHIYVLDTSALATESALQEALAALPADATHAAVQLKAKGGSLHYATALEDAMMSSAVASFMPLETIRDAIRNAGFEPVAVINAYEDHIYPRTFASAGYQIAGTEERWLDNTPENNGKPWLSPFSALAEDYLCSVTEEIAAAGFPMILCEGLVYPQFSEADLTMLDPRAGSVEHENQLADSANAMQSHAGDAIFLVKADSTSLLQAAGRLSADGIAVVVEEDALWDGILAELAEFTCIPVTADGAAEVPDENGNYIVYNTQNVTETAAQETGEAAE